MWSGTLHCKQWTHILLIPNSGLHLFLYEQVLFIDLTQKYLFVTKVSKAKQPLIKSLLTGLSITYFMLIHWWHLLTWLFMIKDWSPARMRHNYNNVENVHWICWLLIVYQNVMFVFRAVFLYTRLSFLIVPVFLTIVYPF